MPASPSVRVALALAAAFAPVFVSAPAAAQNAAHAHVGHVTDGWRDTPDGQGLLPTAMAEARVAAQHAGLAARNPDNLNSMKSHTRHVLHAVDPSHIENGPGAGYGVVRAANGAARHIELAAEAEGASDGVKTHSVHIATSLRNTLTRAKRMVELARRIESSTSAEEAAPLVTELDRLGQALLAGTDADGDGGIGWQEGEGGLEVAETHAGLLKRGEGLG